AQTRDVDVDAPPARGQLLERDPALHARERGAEAAVHTVTEPDRDPGLPFDVELVGGLERTRIPGRRAGEQQHRVPGRSPAALEPAIGEREAPLVLRRRQDA